jgi:hypothetical protein
MKSIWQDHSDKFAKISYLITHLFMQMTLMLNTKKSKEQIYMQIKSHAKLVLNNNYDCLTGLWLGIYNAGIEITAISHPTAFTIGIFKEPYSCAFKRASKALYFSFADWRLYLLTYPVTCGTAKSAYEYTGHQSGNLLPTEVPNPTSTGSSLVEYI